MQKLTYLLGCNNVAEVSLDLTVLELYKEAGQYSVSHRASASRRGQRKSQEWESRGPTIVQWYCVLYNSEGLPEEKKHTEDEV